MSTTALAPGRSILAGASLDPVWPDRPVGRARRLMGGRTSVHLRDDGAPESLGRAAERILDRVATWAGRLTRFDPSSELSVLNAAADDRVAIRPTLAAVLDWAREAESLTGGLVDVAMLDARLGAERGQVVARPLSAARRWSLRRGPRGAVVERELGVRLDLDGVAKGWLADRALRLTTARSAVVDADGDIAVRVAAGDEWAIGIADPRDPVDPSARLATLRLTAERTRREFGVATSGTSVHRWGVTPGEAAHHLIDPATWQPAATDLVQATVLADSARRAEAFAKAAIIAGSRAAFELADRPFVHGLLVLTERGDVLASPGLVRWLA